MSIFKEEVIVDEKSNEIKITVSCEKRKLAIDPKRKYEKNVESLIPEKFQNNVELVSQPSGPVSNMRYQRHCTTGVWVFKIKPARKESTSTTSRRRRTKPATKKQQEKEV